MTFSLAVERDSRRAWGAVFRKLGLKAIGNEVAADPSGERYRLYEVTGLASGEHGRIGRYGAHRWKVHWYVYGSRTGIPGEYRSAEDGLSALQAEFDERSSEKTANQPRA